MGIGITSFLEDCRLRGLTKHTIETYRPNVGTYLDNGTIIIKPKVQ